MQGEETRRKVSDVDVFSKMRSLFDASVGERKPSAKKSSLPGTSVLFCAVKQHSTADRLAQLIEHRTTVREVVGSNPAQTNTIMTKTPHEYMRVTYE